MPAEVSTSLAGARASRRILVADDNEMILAAVRGLIQSLGHSVEVATNGRQAVEAAAREDFDLVFLDVQMPEMGGFEAARSLRDRPAARRRPRIIGVSGEREEPESYRAAGMDDFLLKPIRLAVLIPILQADLSS